MKRFSLLAAMAVSIFLVGCAQKSAESDTGSPEPVKNASTAGAVTTGLKELVKTDVKKSDSKVVVEEGDWAVMLYKGTLKNGTVFDDNMKPTDAPFVFKVGAGGVIAGWDQGIPGMTKGSKRRLEIPGALAYGDSSPSEKIPANSDLYFDVELLEVIKADGYGDYIKNTVKPGSGPEAKTGDKITVHYTGKLLNGKKFDSSKDRNEPFTITLGAGQVIKGWEIGLVGMKKGEVRMLRLMPGAAYGEQGTQGIDPNQPLDFEVECLAIN
jgi:peptidylprolyl isomerase